MMTTTRWTLLIPVLLLALLLGCGGDGSTLGPDGQPLPEDGDDGDNGDLPVVTLSQLNAEIFTPKCATSGCHGGAFVSANLTLEADKIAAQIIDVPSVQVASLKRIDPGNPDDSYLIHKVRGTGANGQMPLGRTPLSAAEIQLLVDWVAAGASTE